MHAIFIISAYLLSQQVSLSGAVFQEPVTKPISTLSSVSPLKSMEKDISQQVESFCIGHPDHNDAQLALFFYRVEFAKQHLQGLMPAGSAARSSEGPFHYGFSAMNSQVRPEPLVRPMTEVEDQKWWGPCEQQLRRLFISESWLESMNQPIRIPLSACHSPLMREACRVHLSTVEDMLRRYPSHPGLWELWFYLARTSGRGSIRALLQTLHAMPGANALPPNVVLDFYVKECRESGAWATLYEVMPPHWEGFKDFVQLVRGLGPENRKDTYKDAWERILEPLLEATLRVGDIDQAETLLQEGIQFLNIKNLPQLASRVALQCGNPALAKHWSNLATE